MGIDNVKLKPSSRICSDHFEGNCVGKKSRLKRGSVPTLFFGHRIKCAFCGEEKTGKHKYFHRFPINEPRIIQKWLMRLGKENFSPTKNDYLCYKHFTEDQYVSPKGRGKKVLKKHAIPSIFHSPNCEGEVNGIQDIDQDANRNENEHVEVMIDPTLYEHVQHPPVQQNCSSSVTGPEDLEPGRMSPEWYEAEMDKWSRATLERLEKKLQSTKERLKKTQVKLKVRTQKLKRSKRTIVRLKEVIRDLKERRLASENCPQEPAVDADVTQFLGRCSQNQSKTKRGVNVTREKYPPALRLFASTLHSYSPKAYLFVREKFQLSLPHERTIRSWSTVTDGKSGPSKDNSNSLEEIGNSVSAVGVEILQTDHTYSKQTFPT